MIVGSGNPFELLGRGSLVSVSIMILTICFAKTAVWSVANVIKERHAKIKGAVLVHKVLVSIRIDHYRSMFGRFRGFANPYRSFQAPIW